MTEKFDQTLQSLKDKTLIAQASQANLAAILAQIKTGKTVSP